MSTKEYMISLGEKKYNSDNTIECSCINNMLDIECLNNDSFYIEI